MKIIVNGTAYRCTGKPSLKEPVRFTLPDGQPDPAALGDTIRLQTDSGTVLREITVADYARWYVSGTYLIGTNAPEPEPVEETPMSPELTYEDRLTAAESAISVLMGV